VKVLGPETYKMTQTLWSSVTLGVVDLSILKTFSTSSAGVTKASPPVFDDYSSIYSATRSSTKHSSRLLSVLARVLRLTPFHLHYSSLADTRSPRQRQRTEKALPPKHLGDDDGKSKDRRTKERMLRNNPRFRKAGEKPQRGERRTARAGGYHCRVSGQSGKWEEYTTEHTAWDIRLTGWFTFAFYTTTTSRESQGQKGEGAEAELSR